MSISPATITNLVSEEVSKYQDLHMITDKLKNKGYYDRILEVLLELFKEEAIFTHTELDRILSIKGEQAELMEQFWINSEVFRSNLVLIFTSMSKLLLHLVNSIWRSEDLVRQVLEERLSGGEGEDQGKITFGHDSPHHHIENIGRKDMIKSALEQGRKDFAKVSNSMTHAYTKKYQGNASYSDVNAAKPSGRSGKVGLKTSAQKERVLKGARESEITLASKKLAVNEEMGEEADEHGDVDQSHSHDRFKLHSGGKIYQSDVDLKVPEEAFFKKSSKASKGTLNEPERNRSRSFDRNSFHSATRPRSGSRGSRNLAADYSQYSSVHSRILNAGEVNKIRKLVGDKNSDLDVASF